MLVPIGADGLRFALDARTVLWPGVPIVFAGVDPETVLELKGAQAVTGVAGIPQAEGTVRLALALFPETRRVVLAGGDSSVDRVLVDLARRRLAGLSDRVQVLDPGGIAIDDPARVLGSVPDDAVVLWVSFSHAASVRRTDVGHLVNAIMSASRRPVFVMAQSFLGRGAIGGHVLGADPIAQRAGALVARVIGGTPVDRIPIDTSVPPVTMLDARQVARWNVARSRLPAEAVLMNREPSLWEDFRPELLMALAALVLLVLLSAVLFLERRRRSAAELEARERLALAARMARSATMGQLSAALAHELNQPLGAILNNVEAARMMLSLQPPALADAAEALQAIRDDNLRASQVVRKVRGLYERQSLALSEVDPTRFVSETLSLVEADARRRRVTLTSDLPGRLWTLAADVPQLQQVLLNLVFNAMDAVQDQPPARRDVRVTAANLDNDVQFSVIDTGHGIAPGVMPLLFKPFFTTRTGGLGMGLSIAKSGVEAQGGRIWPELLPAGGAAFHFTVPRWVPLRHAHPQTEGPGVFEQPQSCPNGQVDGVS